MSDKEPVSFWNRAWNDPRRFFFWLGLLSFAGFALGLTINAAFRNFNPPPWFQNCAILFIFCLAMGIVVGLFGTILSLIPPVRRWLGWLLQRRFFALLCMVTFIALLYAE